MKSLLKRTKTNSCLTRYGKVGGRVNYGWSRVTNWRREGGPCYAISAQLLCGTMDTRAANCGGRSTRGGDSFPASIAVRSSGLPTVTAQLEDTWPQASVCVRNAQRQSTINPIACIDTQNIPAKKLSFFSAASLHYSIVLKDISEFDSFFVIISIFLHLCT